MRLDRFLANMGCGSRNQVKLMLRSGKITLNGAIIKNGTRHIIPWQDQVVCLGELIDYREFIYLMLNKPAGIISAAKDLKERTVLDLIADKYHNQGLFPVGRLDKDTEGLLILTNDGVLGHRLLAPKKHVAKRYYAKIAGTVGTKEIEAFRDGIVLDDGYRTMPAQLETINSDDFARAGASEVIIEIYEGKFHQIKRMMQALGKQVIYLKRIAMGDLALDPALGPGEYRELSEPEIRLLAGSDGAASIKTEPAEP
jgi:16S rRNA pseudouridine516 synthase